MMWITHRVVCGKVGIKKNKKYMKKVINNSVRELSPAYADTVACLNPLHTTHSTLFPIFHTPSNSNSLI